MSDRKATLAAAPCLCNALRRASRVATRLYDRELRAAGLRTTQFSLLRLLRRMGEVRQGDLGPLAVLDETSLTRALRPLVSQGLAATREGSDRRERLVSITAAGKAKLTKARPAWQRTQERVKSSLSTRVWEDLMGALPKVAQL